MKEALDTYKLGLEKDKKNVELLNSSNQLESALKKQKLFKDPLTKRIMDDPNFKNIIEFAKKEPENFLEMMQTVTGIDFQKMKENNQKSSEKSNLDDTFEENEEIFLHDIKIENEGNIKGHSKAMTKKDIDDLFGKRIIFM